MEVEEQGEKTGVKTALGTAAANRDSGGGMGAGSGQAHSEKVSDAVSGTGAEAVRGGSGEREPGGEHGRSEEEKKLWAIVSANPSDFKTWTSLLQLTEQNVGSLSLSLSLSLSFITGISCRLS